MATAADFTALNLHPALGGLIGRHLPGHGNGHGAESRHH